jgi:LytS/YehU family sensor histidine kinase
VLARPAYAIGSLIDSRNPAASYWLDSFHAASPDQPGAWYAWLSNAVEYSFLYLSCTAVTLGFFSFVGLTRERRLRVEVEGAVTRERLRALRAQVNPHFLFNSLNSIVSLSDAHPTTQVLVTQLSDLLRRTLRASEKEEQELFEELTYVEEYLEIEQTRQPSRIDWRIRVEAGCARAAVPSLILMPLVENAVTHGMRGGVDRVVIEIVAWRTHDRLLICVANTCSDSLPMQDVTRPGMGLRNVRGRLDVSFGAAASLVADRADPGRFEVQINLPVRELRPTRFREEPPCAS